MLGNVRRDRSKIWLRERLAHFWRQQWDLRQPAAENTARGESAGKAARGLKVL